MNSKQAKQLPLPQIMSRLGYQPVKERKGGGELWYKSPFRSETEPSFITSYIGGKWIWNDFGDIGGTVIDFVMRHENYTSVKDALAFLENMFHGDLFSKPTSNRIGEIRSSTSSTLFSSNQQSRAAAENFSADSELEFLKARSIRNPIIYHYLEQRGIPKELVDRYLVEVKYHNTAKGKDYFAFGMENESGGYEIRAASDEYSFKSALKGRDVTLIRGTVPERKTVNVFEGMTDFLSLLVMMKSRNLSGDSLIMHSLSSFAKASAILQREEYATINTFLDNDTSGQETTHRFEEAFPERVTSYSKCFAPHSDLNDALLSGTVPDFRSSAG